MKEYYKRYMGLITIAIITSTIVVLTMLPYPLVFKYFIDTVIPKKDMNAIVIWSIFLFLIIIIRVIVNFFQNYITALIEERTARDLKRDLMDKVMRLKMPFFIKNDTGSIMSRILNDATKSTGLFRNYYLVVYKSSLFVAFAVIIMSALDIWLTIVSLVLIPILGMVTGRLNLKMTSESEKLSNANQTVMKEVQEAISGIETIKVDNLYNKTQKSFLKSLNNLVKINVNINKYGALAGAFLTGLVSLGPIVLLIIGAYLVLKGNTTIGTVVAITNYLFLLYEPIQQISVAKVQSQTPKAIWKSVWELLNQEEERMDGKSVHSHEVIYNGVEFGYDNKHTILRNISLKVPQGKFVAIVGATGTGKSTLVKLIPGFYEPNNGQVKIGDSSVCEASLGELRKRIAFINRNPYIFLGTIKENILLGSEAASQKEIEEAAKLACIDRDIEAMGGYDSFVGVQGKALSDGQRVRLAIARAVLKKPKIMIIDEALTTVDSATETRIMQNLRQKFSDMTIILISHRLSSCKLADELYLLEEGTIAEKGTYESIKNSKTIRNLFAEQLM